MMRNESQGYMNRISNAFESFLDSFSNEESNNNSTSEISTSVLTNSTVTVSSTDESNQYADYAYIKQLDDEATNILLPENLKVSFSNHD